MTFLFYVQPLVEICNPVGRHVGWFDHYIPRAIKAIRAGFGPESQIHVATSSDIAAAIPKECLDLGLRRVPLEQYDLLDGYRYNYLELTKDWQLKGQASEKLDHVERLLRVKLKGIDPDVVFVISTPAPFLEKVFPKALILYRDSTIFARPPFDCTHYLDPLGTAQNSLASRFCGSFDAMPVAPEGRKILEEFREASAKVLASISPFSSLLSDLRQRWRRLLLLPLQPSRLYMFDSLSNYANQYEYLEHALRFVPADTALIATQHVVGRELWPQHYEHLKKKHPNFVYDERFDVCQNVSQLLVPEVDGVINVSSTVGLQALFHKKRLISLGEYFKDVSDANSLENLPDVLDREPADRTAFMLWLLTRYAIPPDYIDDPAWLCGFIRRSLEKKERGLLGPEFFDPIDSMERIMACHRSYIDKEALASPPQNVELPESIAKHSSGRDWDLAFDFMKAEGLPSSRVHVDARLDGLLPGWTLFALPGPADLRISCERGEPLRIAVDEPNSLSDICLQHPIQSFEDFSGRELELAACVRTNTHVQLNVYDGRKGFCDQDIPSDARWRIRSWRLRMAEEICFLGPQLRMHTQFSMIPCGAFFEIAWFALRAVK